jgi:hypothetical protein
MLRPLLLGQHSVNPYDLTIVLKSSVYVSREINRLKKWSVNVFSHGILIIFFWISIEQQNTSADGICSQIIENLSNGAHLKLLFIF